MQREFQKVNTEQVFMMWRNVALPMFALIMLHVLSVILPPMFAPVISTATAIFLYYQVVLCSGSKNETCAIVPYVFFFVVVTYTIMLIIINLIYLWGKIPVPGELIFFEGAYLEPLVLAPVGFLTTLVLYLRRRNLTLCVNCKITNGMPISRGRVGLIYSTESEYQMRNIMGLYALVMIVDYPYYLFEFIDVTISQRDLFIFSGIAIFVYLFDILYFGMRYYNLYLDLKESDELISPSDLDVIGTRTYVRFYVICGDAVYMATSSLDGKYDDESDVIDTPYTIKRNVSGFHEPELKQFIEEQTGVKGGELRFFYGRRLADAAGRKLLRYFYFLPGDISDYPTLKVQGEWVDSDKLKKIYHSAPDRLTSVCLSDISRIALITITSKKYKPNGERRNRLTHYCPSFTLREIQPDNLDFQNDKWIRVSMFNSDTSFFKIKRWWRQRFHRTYFE